eukprot:1157960-Pelagomonas_calceolata.AAC.7
MVAPLTLKPLRPPKSPKELGLDTHKATELAFSFMLILSSMLINLLAPDALLRKLLSTHISMIRHGLLLMLHGASALLAFVVEGTHGSSEPMGYTASALGISFPLVDVGSVFTACVLVRKKEKKDYACQVWPHALRKGHLKGRAPPHRPRGRGHHGATVPRWHRSLHQQVGLHHGTYDTTGENVLPATDQLEIRAVGYQCTFLLQLRCPCRQARFASAKLPPQAAVEFNCGGEEPAAKTGVDSLLLYRRLPETYMKRLI